MIGDDITDSEASFDDLVPFTVEILCGAVRFRRTSVGVSAWIRSALIEHLHVAIVHAVRGAALGPSGIEGALEIVTSDRYSAPGAPRDELIDRIALALDGDRSLADALLVVVELRTDISLMQQKRVRLAGIGTLESTTELGAGEGYALTYPSILDTEMPVGILWSRGRRQRLQLLLDEIRLSALSRAPLPYRLTVMPVTPLPTERRPPAVHVEGAFETNVPREPVSA